MKYLVPLLSISTMCAVNLKTFAQPELLFSVKCIREKGSKVVYIDVTSNNGNQTAYLTGSGPKKAMPCYTNHSNALVCTLDDSTSNVDDYDPMTDIHTFRKNSNGEMTYNHFFAWGVTLDLNYKCHQI